jgi:hypothetical protein
VSRHYLFHSHAALFLGLLQSEINISRSYNTALCRLSSSSHYVITICVNNVLSNICNLYGMFKKDIILGCI